MAVHVMVPAANSRSVLEEPESQWQGSFATLCSCNVPCDSRVGLALLGMHLNPVREHWALLCTSNMTVSGYLCYGLYDHLDATWSSLPKQTSLLTRRQLTRCSQVYNLLSPMLSIVQEFMMQGIMTTTTYDQIYDKNTHGL